LSGVWFLLFFGVFVVLFSSTFPSFSPHLPDVIFFFSFPFRHTNPPNPNPPTHLSTLALNLTFSPSLFLSPPHPNTPPPFEVLFPFKFGTPPFSSSSVVLERYSPPPPSAPPPNKQADFLHLLSHSRKNHLLPLTPFPFKAPTPPDPVLSFCVPFPQRKSPPLFSPLLIMIGSTYTPAFSCGFADVSNHWSPTVNFQFGRSDHPPLLRGKGSAPPRPLHPP